MKPLSIRAELKKNDITTVLDVPCNDYGIDIALQNLGETDMTETMQFCSHLGGDIPELAVLSEETVNVDELNFLAKYLDSMTDKELRQFQAAMTVTKPTEIKDMINLAFNLHNYTLITDFSDMAAVGKNHLLNVERAVSAEMDDFYNFSQLGESLLTSGKGTVTPYGVLFVNDLTMQTVYDGQTFPQYLYEECVFEVTVGYGDRLEYLYLPCAESSIDRAMHRLGASDLADCSLENIDGMVFSRDSLSEIKYGFDASDIKGLNELSAVLTDFEQDDMKKLVAVCDCTDVSEFSAAARIAENLDSFEFAPGVEKAEGLGQYLIKESGHYEYDSELDDYYNYEALGEDTADTQGGKFTSYGHIGIKDDLKLSDILGEDEDITMGGM